MMQCAVEFSFRLIWRPFSVLRTHVDASNISKGVGAEQMEIRKGY